jgi:hypothetical protein
MFVTVESCVLFEVRPEFLNIIYTCFGFKRLIPTNNHKTHQVSSSLPTKDQNTQLLHIYLIVDVNYLFVVYLTTLSSNIDYIALNERITV